MFRYLLSFFLFSGGGHIDQNGIFDYNVKKRKKKKKDSKILSGTISECTMIWPQGYKKNSYLTQLSTKFILLINVKMPTIVGILTFISMINTTSERHKARNFFICRYFSFYEQFYKPWDLGPNCFCY